jgi:hypothetical protein
MQRKRTRCRVQGRALARARPFSFGRDIVDPLLSPRDAATSGACLANECLASPNRVTKVAGRSRKVLTFQWFRYKLYGYDRRIVFDE